MPVSSFIFSLVDDISFGTSDRVSAKYVRIEEVIRIYMDGLIRL